MDARILERVAREGELQSLTHAELELDRLPITIDPHPQGCKAWVRFGASAVRVDALIDRWTPRAIGIRFDVAGREARTWVWASAVERTSS